MTEVMHPRKFDDLIDAVEVPDNVTAMAPPDPREAQAVNVELTIVNDAEPDRETVRRDVERESDAATRVTYIDVRRYVPSPDKERSGEEVYVVEAAAAETKETVVSVSVPAVTAIIEYVTGDSEDVLRRRKTSDFRVRAALVWERDRNDVDEGESERVRAMYLETGELRVLDRIVTLISESKCIMDTSGGCEVPTIILTWNAGVPENPSLSEISSFPTSTARPRVRHGLVLLQRRVSSPRLLT